MSSVLVRSDTSIDQSPPYAKVSFVEVFAGRDRQQSAKNSHSTSTKPGSDTKRPSDYSRVRYTVNLIESYANTW